MGPTVTFLISIGLCLDWAVRAQMDTLPRPTLWAVPSPVVPKGADVTLRCQGHLGSDRFQLWNDGELRDERNESWQQAEFVLRNVDDQRDARSYSCRSGQGPWWSEPSEALALVVTGALPKPTVSTSHYYTVYPGTRVTIWCQMAQQMASPQDYSFALLEAKSLEPFQRQSPAGTQAVFLLLSVGAKDAGRYSCIYYKKTAPYRGSHPSEILELTVYGLLPRPTFWAQSGLVMAPGANITLWCSRPKLSSLKEVTFSLYKAGTQRPLQQQTSADLWTGFLLPSVRLEDTGSYSCSYMERTVSAKESEPSEALELLVPGSLPRPSLSALPGLVVESGMHVTLQCWQPHQTFLSDVTFILLKVGTPQPLQSQSPGGTSAAFPLLSVRAQDAGNYSCVYYRKMVPYQVSKPSQVLEIWVTDALPKPSLSAWPGPEVVSGTNVTLLCQGPSWRTRFILHKEGSPDTTQDEAQFLLTHVTSKHSGNYSCRYQPGTNSSLWTQPSDHLEITVREPSNTLLITLSCVSSLLLCLFLLVFFCHRSTPLAGDLHGDSLRRFFCCSCHPWSACLPRHPEAPRDEALYTQVAEKTPTEPSVPMAEDPEGVTYAHLNIRTLNKRQADPQEKSTESTVYASVS
ncbi:immunoglobulin superfamily member 1-like isoform X3 [Phascolarctos cinereus]|uniref:immunoglobulin superfamily member 1-like isoform X1 n=1 Tax=Phascolarctos cinereus TaxID=38626 RepID=UPI000A28567B|nr:immunoglobulin superfamily member 1-like isoform X1 [Phascolarctos cinereus]XP_020859796.1 immunoglobulin superfamily member 1-like isoform X1 [Phascolarctos cinereus]XP_020859797.1 immunoglobulin superfamily member 1-like isoform X1 [Phascolarctos cinereus]XP_020859798.1 immunoglobulin superfamily member 1-like isoform X1 [Phascolarctos cinereus]